ncbi:hypothetical protein ANCCAN_29595 [Ancylostoma caninum]|uniref:Uncharacterized protein n=1 Tax=Ancylostoma caninum TaxID=29170 RepID=A0A368EY22_ANCCA|nr:hypothetical protein ANCCAN_29595 [Ancylostoma caninum]
MVMVQDEAFTQYYKEIAQALLTIFRSLGDSFPQYVQQCVYSAQKTLGGTPINRSD